MPRIFYWDDQNEEHVAEHDVSREEAEHVVSHPSRGFPRRIERKKYLSWGQSLAGRYLQVIHVLRPSATIDLTRLDPVQRLLLQSVREVIYVIHARDLSEQEKRQLRRRQGHL